MAAIACESPWFRSYSRAVLTDDLLLRRVYVNDALDAISETIRRQDLPEDERQAVSVAAHELHLLERDRFSKGHLE